MADLRELFAAYSANSPAKDEENNTAPDQEVTPLEFLHETTARDNFGEVQGLGHLEQQEQPLAETPQEEGATNLQNIFEASSNSSLLFGDTPDVKKLEADYRRSLSQEKARASRRSTAEKPYHIVGTLGATGNAFVEGMDSLLASPDVLADADWSGNFLGRGFNSLATGVESMMLGASDFVGLTNEDTKLNFNLDTLESSITKQFKERWNNPDEHAFRQQYLQSELTKAKEQYLALSPEEKASIKAPSIDDPAIQFAAFYAGLNATGLRDIRIMRKHYHRYKPALANIVDSYKNQGKYADHDLRSPTDIATSEAGEHAIFGWTSTKLNQARMGTDILYHGAKGIVADGAEKVGLGDVIYTDPFVEDQMARNFASLSRSPLAELAADTVRGVTDIESHANPVHNVRKYLGQDPYITKKYNVTTNTQLAAEDRYQEFQNKLDKKYGKYTGDGLKDKARLLEEARFVVTDSLSNPSVIAEGAATSAAALAPDMLGGAVGKSLKLSKLNRKTKAKGLDSDVAALELEGNKLLAKAHGDKRAKQLIVAQAAGGANEAYNQTLYEMEKEGYTPSEEQKKRMKQMFMSSAILDYFGDSLALKAGGMGSKTLRKIGSHRELPKASTLSSGTDVFVERLNKMAANSFASGAANTAAVELEARARQGGSSLSGLSRADKHLAFGQGAAIGFTALPGMSVAAYKQRRTKLAAEGEIDRISEVVDTSIAKAFNVPLNAYRRFVRGTAEDSGANLSALHETYNSVIGDSATYDTSHLTEEEIEQGGYNPVRRVMNTLMEHETKEEFYSDESISAEERSTEAVLELRGIQADLRNALIAITDKIENESDTLTDEQITDLQLAQGHASALLKGVGVTYASALKSINQAIKMDEGRDEAIKQKFLEAAETSLSFFDPLAYTEEELAAIEQALGTSPSKTSKMLLESVKRAREAAEVDKNGNMEQTTSEILKSKNKKTFGQVSNEAMYGNPDKPGHYGIRDYNAMLQGAIATGDTTTLSMIKERIAGWINSEGHKYAPTTIAQNAAENALKMDIYNRAETALAEITGREADTRTLDTVLSPDGVAPTSIARNKDKNKKGLIDRAKGKNDKETNPTHKEDNSINEGKTAKESTKADTQKEETTTKTVEGTKTTEGTPSESPTSEVKDSTHKEDITHNYGSKDQIKTSLDTYSTQSNEETTPKQRRETLVDLFRGAKHLQHAIENSTLDTKVKKKLLGRVANMLQAVTRLAEAEKEIAKHGFKNKELNKAIGTQKGRITRAINNLPDIANIPIKPKAAQATPAPAPKVGKETNSTYQEDISTPVPDYVIEVVPEQSEVDSIADYYAQNPNELLSEKPTETEIESVTAITHGEENGATTETDTPSEGTSQLSIVVKEDPIITETVETEYDQYLESEGKVDSEGKTPIQETVEVLETLYNEEDSTSRGVFYKFFKRAFTVGKQGVFTTAIGLVNDYVKTTFFAPKNTPLINTKGIVTLIVNGEGVFSNSEVLFNEKAFVKASLFHLESMRPNEFTQEERSRYTENLTTLHKAVMYFVGKTPEDGFLMIPGEGVSDFTVSEGSPLYEIQRNQGKGMTITNSPLSLLLAHREGEQNYMPENLRFVLALATLDWVNSTGQSLELLDIGAINSNLGSLFGVDGLAEKIVNPKAYENLQRMGVPSYTVDRQLGGLALNMLNIKLDPSKVPAGTRELLEAQLGVVLRNGLVASGVLEETSIPSSVIAEGVLKATVNPETGETVLGEVEHSAISMAIRKPKTYTMVRMRGKYSAKVKDGRKLGQQFTKPKLYERIKSAFEGTYTIATDLVQTPSKSPIPRSKPINVKSLKLPTGIPKRLRKGLEAKAKQGFVVRGHVKELFRDTTLSKEAIVEKLAEMLGVDTEEQLDSYHWSRRISKRASRDADIKTIENFVTVMQQNPELLDNPMYFTPTFYKNARTGYEETLINPQQNKLQRALLAPDKSNIEVSDDSITAAPIIWKKALYGGLSALGIKDSSSRHAVDRALKQVQGFYTFVWGDPEKNEEGDSIMQNLLEVGAEDLSKITLDDFHHMDSYAKQHGFKGDTPLERVQGMLYVYQVSRFPHTNQAFKPEYQVEADGKTNGYYITLTQFPIKRMEGTEADWFNRVGFFSASNDPKTSSPFSDYMSQEGALDSYEAMGVDAVSEFSIVMSNRGKLGDLQRKQLESILGNLINPDGSISSAIRNFMKDPFMKANYDAGAKSIVTALFDVIGDSIGEKLEDFHTRFATADNVSEANKVQKELDSFNQLFGTRFTKENLLTSGRDYTKVHKTLTNMGNPNKFNKVVQGDGAGTVLAKTAFNSIVKPTGEIAKAKTAYSNGFNALWEAYTNVRAALMTKKLKEVAKEDNGRNYLTQAEVEHIESILEGALPMLPHALNENGEDYRLPLSSSSVFTPKDSDSKNDKVAAAYGAPSTFSIMKPKSIRDKTPPTRTVNRNKQQSVVKHKTSTGTTATRWLTPPGANFLARFAQMIDGAIMISTLGKELNYLDVHDGADTSPIQHYDVARALNESAADITSNFNGAVEVEKSLVRGFKTLLKVSESNDLGFTTENLIDPDSMVEMPGSIAIGTLTSSDGKPVRMEATLDNILTDVARATEMVQASKININKKVSLEGDITISQYNALPAPEESLNASAKMNGYNIDGGILPTGIADLVPNTNVRERRAGFNVRVNRLKEEQRKAELFADKANENSSNSLGSTPESSNRVEEAAKGINAVALSAAYLKELVSKVISWDGSHSKEYIHAMQNLVSDVLSPLLDAASDRSITVIQDALQGVIQADGSYNTDSKTVFLNVVTKGVQDPKASNLEVLLHETVHAVTVEALNTNPDFRREMHRLYSRARDVIKPEMLLPINPVTGKPTTDPDMVREAEESYDYIFNNPKMINPSKDGKAFQQGLAEFVAYAATNETLRNALKHIPITGAKDATFDKTTLLGRILNLFSVAVGKLAQMFTDAPKGSETLSQFDNLLKSLVATQTKTVENPFNKGWNKITEFTGRGSDMFRRKISDPAFMELSRAYDDLARGYEDREAHYARSLKNVSAMLSAAMAIKGYTEAEIDKKMNEIAADSKPLPRAMYELRQVTGTSTDSLINTIKDTIFDKHGNADIALTKAIGSISAISAERENYEIAVRKKYQDFHKSVSKEENLAITNAMHSDVGLLFELFQDDPATIDKFITSPEYRKTMMKDARKKSMELLKDHPQKMEIFNALFAQGEGLARRMVHGTTDYAVNQQPNAIRIVNGYMFAGTPVMDTFTNIPSEIREGLLDNLDLWISIKAYEMLPESTHNNISAVWKRESTMGNDTNMLTELFLEQRGNKNLAEKLLFDEEGEFLSMTKGYVPTIYPADVDVKTVSSADVSNYTKQGYKVDRSFKAFNGKDLYVVVKKVPQRPRHVEGAMPVLSEGAAGVSASDLLTLTEGKGVKINSKWVKEAATDLTKVAIEQQFSKDPQNVNKNRPSESLPVPIQDVTGDFTDLRYLVSEKSKREVFKKDLDFLNIIARDSSKTLGKYAAKEHGMKTLDALIADYEANKDATLLYTWVSPDPINFDGTKNPYYNQYRMLPKEVRMRAHKVFGGKGIPIRKGMVHLVLGYEEFSVNQTKFMQKLNKKYPKLEDTVRTVENLWIESVRYAKDRIAVASVKVFRMNLVSNIMLQLANGMSLFDVVKYSSEAIRGLNEYTANMNKITELRNKASVTKDPKVRMRLYADIANIEGLMENSEIKEMVDNGLYQSISTEVKPKETDFFPKMGRSIDKFGRKMVGDKVYDVASAVPKNLLMTRDSVSYKTMYTFTQSMDFVARYGLMKHLKKIDSKKPDSEKLGNDRIYKIVLDSFINYAAPDHKGLKYSNDIGVLWFTKYYLGIQRVVADLWKRKPIEAAALAMYQASVTDIYDIFDDSIINRSPFSVVNQPISKTVETLSTPALVGNMNYIFGFGD